MRKTVLIGLLLAAGLTMTTGAALAVEPESGQDTIAISKAVAVDALNGMSKYLRSLGKFTIQANADVDEVLANGQKVQLSRIVQIKTVQPEKLWVKTSNKYTNQEYFYDGKTFTIVTPELNVYASFAAPATIGEMIVKARDTFSVELPLSDLFLWGSRLDAADAVKEAIIVGQDQINGRECTQYALRGSKVDWQIWIQKGEAPFPLKLVITDRKEETQPQYSVVLNWDTAPTFDDQSFTFVPDADDVKINFDLAEVSKQETAP